MPSSKDKHKSLPLRSPPWVCSAERQRAIDAMTKLLPKPSLWPDISVLFEFDGAMKTAEALLKCGPVGQYQYQWLDCDPEYRRRFIESKIVFETAMRKTSSPAERVYVEEALPRIFTELEIMMPIQFQTGVRHQCGFHVVANLEDLGPYPLRTMLNFERFHTTFKALCRNRNNPLASIEAHYELLEFCLTQRLSEPDAWSLPAPRSSPAGYLARPESSKRGGGQLDIALKGVMRQGTLSDEDYKEVQQLWRIFDPEYEALWNIVERRNRLYSSADARRVTIATIEDSRQHALTPKDRLFKQMTAVVTVRVRIFKTKILTTHVA
jgi:hypothetical protein